MSVTMMKPVITKSQIVKSSEASKRFGQIKKMAKNTPLYITDNGNIDTVLVGYEYFEKMYQRLNELEKKEELLLLENRIADIENNPSLSISWKNIRRKE
ncbi:type II toxin-antitoxin system Phd/YefM family antitoxin [Bacteroidales bacterium MSK.15.36]|nr:type II toxin-antitoxin system Phd/YefM family antitoxin [Bacteroidales bacterium MSK.15.36]